MPGKYAGRRKTGRKGRPLSKAAIVSKTSAKDQSKQILALQSQVNKLRVGLNDRTQYSQYHSTHYGALISHGVSSSHIWQPAIYRPISPDQWQSIFQTPSISGPNADDANKFRGRSIGFEHMIQLADPEEGNGDPVTCTLYCVSLRKETAQQFLKESQHFTNLNQPRHYVRTNMGTLQGAGMVMLNKGIFKIRYCKRFMIGANTDFNVPGEETKTTNLKDNNKRIYTSIKYPNVLKSGRGDRPWKTLALDEVEDTDQLCWMLFHNAYDTQALSWATNSVITGQITN